MTNYSPFWPISGPSERFSEKPRFSDIPQEGRVQRGCRILTKFGNPGALAIVKDDKAYNNPEQQEQQCAATFHVSAPLLRNGISGFVVQAVFIRRTVRLEARTKSPSKTTSPL